MNKIFNLILINLLFISCINLIIEGEEYYESIILKGSGWFEFYQDSQTNGMNLNEDFTFQIWFSGYDNIITEAPCILNLNGDSDNLTLYKSPSIENNLMIYFNNIFQEAEIDGLNLNNQTEFHLLSVIQDSASIKIYIDDILIFNQDTTITIDHITVGGVLNPNNQVSHLWFGHIDEMRLWNTALTSEVITLHNEYPYKVSSSYEDEYLNNLMGLWEFKINTTGETPSNIWQDINNHDFYTILYTLESMSNEFSIIGR